MKLIEIYQKVDQVAPFVLSREMMQGGAYDNSGILLDSGEEVKSVLFSLDLSRAAAEEAIQTGANCVITHHPAIYAPLKKITKSSAVGMCMRAGISVISAHLNLDAAPGGIDESLMHALGGTKEEQIMQKLSLGGYGRVYEVPVCSMQELMARVKEEMHGERVISYGNAPVRRIASFCGGGLDEEALDFAIESGADTVVSSEGRHHLLVAAVEAGLNILLLTHACSEEYGFTRFYLRMREELNISCAYYAEKRFL